MHKIEEDIGRMKSEIFAEMDKHIAQSVKAAVGTTLQDLAPTLLSRIPSAGYNPCFPASSCKEILQLAPKSPSGLYWIRGTNNSSQHMYCDMDKSCKNVTGGWMRVAYIDMHNTNSTCPSGLRTLLISSLRLCAMNIDGAGCSSTFFPVNGIEYSQVCGKIIGYQQKTPDAFASGHNTTDTNYVDGISVTHGESPRKHIWTFAAAVHEHNSVPTDVCPCTNTRNTPPPPSVPPFVANDYFCDTGNPNRFEFTFFRDDPLWDGAGCGEYNTCCDWNSPPWFRKEISPPTRDDIEIRLCADQARNDEDINFEILELYVQ